MGGPSASMGRTTTPATLDSTAYLMAALSSVLDASRSCSRDGTPRWDAYGASFSMLEDQT
ncbi:MAG: hypothetical protein M3319_09040 [Actinomycetota bacterium]|nr:hypothetical protein [Actinomycetota bacterium]